MFYFESNYVPEFETIVKTLDNIYKLQETCTDKKLIKTTDKLIEILKQKIQDAFKDITPNENGIKVLTTNHATNYNENTKSGTHYDYHYTGLLKTPDSCIDDMFLEPFDFTPITEEEQHINIPTKLLFAYTNILANKSYCSWHMSKADKIVRTGLPENFSQLLYNYILYVSGTKKSAGECSLIKLKKDIKTFKQKVSSHSSTELQPLFDKIQDEYTQINKLIEQQDKETDAINTENAMEYRTQEIEIYNKYEKLIESHIKSAQQTFKIILEELKICKKIESRVTKAIGFVTDTNESYNMYKYASTDIDMPYDCLHKPQNKSTGLDNPIFILKPTRKLSYTNDCLPYRRQPRGNKYDDNTGTSYMTYDTYYIEKPEVHIPYMTKDTALNIIDNFKENSIIEEAIYNEHAKTKDKRNTYADKDVEIAYYSSVKTKDYIKENCTIETVPNTDIVNLLLIHNNPDDICYMSEFDESLMHQRFGERTTMYTPDLGYDDFYSQYNSQEDITLDFIKHYDEINKHITNMMDECLMVIDTLQSNLASIDDKDFHEYLIKIKMIEKLQK